MYLQTISKKFLNNGGINMFRKFYTVLILMLFSCAFTLAQTGRVSGKVTDKETGEPLIGANVIIVGTSSGAASDINGEYTIRQVQPGIYSIKASYIGYQDVTVSNVRVVSGLTADQDFQLPSSKITTGEVVIVSQRPLIEKSATNITRIVGSEDIAALPVRDVGKIIALQPGVVQQNGLTYIRGSRSDETGYVLEGADVKNILSRNGGALVSVTPDALQEILVQAGGYTAEFGNANAGIISSDFKTGSDKYHFSVRAETDNLGNYNGNNYALTSDGHMKANSTDRFLNTYSYGYSDYVLTLSGPLGTDKLKVFLSGENNFNRDINPQFFYGNPTAFSDGALLDTTKVYDTGFYSGKTNEYQYLTWNGGNVPGVMDNRYTGNGTILFDDNPIILRLAGAFTWQRTSGAQAGVFSTANTTLIDLYNTARLPVNDYSNLLLNLKGTYLLSPSTFIEANVNYYDARHKTYDPVFGDNFLQYSDSLAASQYGWVFPSYAAPPQEYDFYGFPFNRPGTPLVSAGNGTPNGNLQSYTKDHNNYIGGSVAFTGQVDKHALKVGGSIQRWTVRRFQETDANNFLATIRQYPDQAATTAGLKSLIASTLFRNYNNFGFDVFGNETDAGEFAPKHPLLASGYVEDRIEVNDLIINAGLRYDYIDMDSWAWTNPQLPAVDSINTIPDTSFQSGNTYSYISPRLGFSFPVTDRTVFHLQYGKFVQSPSLDIAYRGVYQVAQELTASNLFTNPVAFNPQPVRTTQYEIGFSQQLTDFAAFDLTAFYKDIKGQLQYSIIYTANGWIPSNYQAFINQDFTTTKGLEFALHLRRMERIRAEFNYTYSDASGTNSFSNSGIGSQQVNKQVPTVLLPLTYNQTHRGSIFLDYRFGKDDGGPILQQLGLNLLFSFNSGHPFTYAQYTGLGQASAWTGGLIPVQDSRGRRPIGPPNSSTTPWNYSIDLRIDKTVSISDFDVNFYVYVQNLLDTKNVINVYQKTGNAYSDGFLNTTDGQQIIAGERYTQRFADLYQALNYDNREAAITTYGYDLFGSPRQLRVGVSINY
jgi:CarboxypepD_reg-like domain/TonB-dependent Receptor Plug Domain